MNGPLDLGFYLKEEQKTALKFAVLPTGYGSNDLYRMTFYPIMLAPMIYLYRMSLYIFFFKNFFIPVLIPNTQQMTIVRLNVQNTIPYKVSIA